MATEHTFYCAKLKDLRKLFTGVSSSKKILVGGLNDIRVIFRDDGYIEFDSAEDPNTEDTKEKEPVKEASETAKKDPDPHKIPVQEKLYGRPVSDEDLRKMTDPPSWYIDAVNARKARIMDNLSYDPSNMYPKTFVLKQDAFLNELRLLMRRYGYNKEVVLHILSGKKKWRKLMKKSLHLQKILKKNRKNQKSLTKMCDLQKKARYNYEFYKIPQ